MRTPPSAPRGASSAAFGITSAVMTTLNQNSINSIQKSGSRAVPTAVPVSKTVTEDKIAGGSALSNNSTNGVENGPHTKNNVMEICFGAGNPSNALSGKTTSTRTVTRGSKSQRIGTDPTPKLVRSILKEGKDPGKKKGVVFREEEQVIGYGGLDDVSETDEDDDGKLA